MVVIVGRRVVVDAGLINVTISSLEGWLAKDVLELSLITSNLVLDYCLSLALLLAESCPI